MKMIQLSYPLLDQKEQSAVSKVLSEKMLAQGKYVYEFEKQFAKYIGVKYAVATSSGTTALHLALLAAGIGKGDEVITSPFTFIASSNAIVYAGAKPVFADIDPETCNIDPKDIERKITKKTKAILPVHLYGLPADMKAINKIAKKHNLIVIEDACQAHGAAIQNKKVGSFGLAGCFSFYPTKNMTTGEGGIVTTNNKKLAEKITLLREHGMKVRYHHDILGYNFRMTNIAAAIGIEQLKKLETFNKKRISNAAFLTKHLQKINGIIPPSIPNGYRHVFHQYTVKITKDYEKSRDEVAKLLAKNNIASGIYYPIPVHKQKVYLDFGYKASLPVSERLAQEVLSLPVHPGLTKEDLLQIIAAFQ